jgi:hypothetical protein
MQEYIKPTYISNRYIYFFGLRQESKKQENDKNDPAPPSSLLK